MPNSFLPKLIFHLHIKGNERRIQNHNPELSLCFSRPGTWCTKKQQRALESIANSKKRPFSCLYHTLLKPLRVACTLNIIIRPYLNFYAEQMKGVGMGFGYLYFGTELECISAETGADDLSKIKITFPFALLCFFPDVLPRVLMNLNRHISRRLLANSTAQSPCINNHIVPFN